MNALNQIIQWQKDASNTEANKNKASLFVGCVFEEVGELLDADNWPRYHDSKLSVNNLENHYKDNPERVFFENKPEIIDALTDIIVFSMAAIMALGEDPEQCLKAVADSNDTKRMPDGSFLKNEQGKIMKPAHYKQPDWSFLK